MNVEFAKEFLRKQNEPYTVHIHNHIRGDIGTFVGGGINTNGGDVIARDLTQSAIPAFTGHLAMEPEVKKRLSELFPKHNISFE
jgi:hypothetical protein